MDVGHAERALGKFGIVPDRIEEVQRRQDRAVWRVSAGPDAYALKWLVRARKAERVERLTDYLRQHGVAVPPVIPARDGMPALDGRKGRFLLFPWIPSRTPRYDEDPGMLERMVTLMARFHEVIRGYGGELPDDLLDWPGQYRFYTEILERVGEQAASMEEPFSRRFREWFPWLRARAAWALDRLPATSYDSLVAAARQERAICHGDYSRANLLLTQDGSLLLIDLDTVNLALPVLDLSRFMINVDHDLRDWSFERWERMIGWYEQVRPISEGERELLLIDQVFPHQAINLARSYYLKEWGSAADTLPEELERCMSTDEARLSGLGVGPVP